MRNNPEYIEVDGKKYKINTSFKVALKCNSLFKDDTIKDYEKLCAIIYMLFGEDALKDRKNYDKLFELAIRYLTLDDIKEDDRNDRDVDMDYDQDYNLIKASFKSDFDIDLNKEDLHWWDFFNYLNGLSENCILNRVRTIRTYDLSEINSEKEKKKIKDAKRRFKLKEKEPELTDKQRESADKFYKLTGIKRR